ncbi:MAG: transporter [Frankiales bacterium]|nr:transporter [Frankiales bacterium]
MSLTSVTTPPDVAAPARAVPVWLSLTALALGGFGIGTTEFASMGVLPDVAGDLGTSIPTAGHLVSAYAVGVVVGAPLLAVVGARLPRKALLLALMCAFTVGNALSALAPTFGSLTLARFATGLPHGAYFGTAAIVAASLVPPQRRARAVARVMLGLTVANIVGVPAATLLGQQAGWRSTYWAVAGIGACAVVGVARWVPQLAALPGASPRRELGALRRPQVWLTLLVGGVGFGGMFAVYSYVAPTLTSLSGFSTGQVPIALALFGVGMTLGTEVGGRLADRSVVGTIAAGLTAVAVVLLLFTVTVHSAVPAAVTVLLIGLSSALFLPALQTRLMDVAGDAQALAAAGNHAALNVANALGAALGGAVLAAGLGYTAPAVVGALLAVGGLGVLGVSVVLERRTARA